MIDENGINLNYLCLFWMNINPRPTSTVLFSLITQIANSKQFKTYYRHLQIKSYKFSSSTHELKILVNCSLTSEELIRSIDYLTYLYQKFEHAHYSYLSSNHQPFEGFVEAWTNWILFRAVKQKKLQVHIFDFFFFCFFFLLVGRKSSMLPLIQAEW